MRKNGRALTLCCLLLAVFAPNCQWAHSQQVYSNVSTKAPVSQSVEGGMWRTDQAFDSVLHMKNVLLTNELQVTPSLIMADGYVLRLPVMIIPAAGVASVNITDVLKHMDASAQAHRSVHGMAGVDYAWKWPGAIMASIQNIDETAMLTFHSSLQSDRANLLAATSQKSKAQIVDGAWWKPYDDAGMFLFLGNSSDTAKEVSVSLLSSKGSLLKKETISLAPRASTFLDAFDMLDEPPETGEAGSLIVSASGPDRSLVALAGIEDSANGFSANLHLYERHPEQAPKQTASPIVLATPGVMLGVPLKDMQFPVSTVFQPYLLLHNASKQAQIVAVSADYRLQGKQQHVALGSLNLNAGAVVQFPFAAMLQNVSPDLGTVSLTENYSGREGDIQVEAGSVDGTGNYVFEAETHTENTTISRTICYWSVQNDTDTMISLWNYSAASEQLLLTLYYQGGKYELPIQLAAGEQSEISVATLLHKQTPDRNGAVLPSNLTEGSAMLSSIAGEDKQIEVSSSTSTFNVRTGTCSNQCGTCNGVTNVYVDPDTVQVIVDDGMQTQGYATYNTGSNYNVTSGSSWSSANTAIMSISSPGYMAGMSPGDTSGGFNLGNQPDGLGYICMGNSFSCPYSSFSDSAPVSVSQAPSISSISPIIYGQTGPLTISGTGLNQYNASTVSITVPGVTIGSITISGDGSQITASYSSSCSAVVGTATLTINSGSSDVPSVSGGVSIVLPTAPTPTILFGGNAISGTQNVVVGQQIALTGSQSLPNCMNLSSLQWGTPSGTSVGGYSASQASASVIPLPSNPGSSYTFYWIASGNGLTQSYTYTMSGGGSSASSPSANVTFNVVGPTSTAVSVATGQAVVVNPGNGPRLSFGSQATGPGFSVNVSATAPQGGHDTYQWVQLINSDVYTRGLGNSATQTCTDPLTPATGSTPYLDKDYPYSFDKTTADSPYTEVLSSSWNTYSRAFSARIYLMYDPGLSNSIVVPLGYVDWSFSGSASLINASTDDWQISTSQPSASSYTPSTSYPTWNAYATGGPNTCH